MHRRMVSTWNHVSLGTGNSSIWLLVGVLLSKLDSLALIPLPFQKVLAIGKWIRGPGPWQKGPLEEDCCSCRCVHTTTHPVLKHLSVAVRNLFGCHQFSLLAMDNYPRMLVQVSLGWINRLHNRRLVFSPLLVPSFKLTLGPCPWNQMWSLLFKFRPLGRGAP